MESRFQILFCGGENAPANPHSKRIGAGIERSKLRIRDVEIAEIHAPVVFASKNVDADSAGGGEIKMRFPTRYLARADQTAAAEFNVRRNSTVRLEIPLHDPGIKTKPIS
jgi:N-methylhydantoinase B/oxoprolinase/acetone carboxylase alpha subunit